MSRHDLEEKYVEYMRTKFENDYTALLAYASENLVADASDLDTEYLENYLTEMGVI